MLKDKSYTCRSELAKQSMTDKESGNSELRPISLLTLSLLRLLDSTFPVNSLWAWEFHPFELRLRLSKTL